MALSKEQLTVQVELDSTGAVKSFKVLNDELSKTSETTKKLDGTFVGFEQTLESVALSVASVSVAMSAVNSGQIPSLIKGLSQTGRAATQTINNLNSMSKELADVSKMSAELASDASKSGIVILKKTSEEAVPAINALGSAVSRSFSNITNSFQMTQAAQLSFYETLMRMVPVIKNGMNEISVAVKTFSGVFVAAFSERGLIGLIKEFAVNIATAFSISNLQIFASGLLKSFSMMKDGAISVGTSIFNIAKDIPNSLDKIKNSFAAIPAIAKDFAAFGKTVVTSHVGPTLIGVAESSLLLKGGLVSLGTALLTSESGFVKLAGGAALVAGILLGGFAFAVKAALGFVGDLISSIGDKLINNMTMMEQKFQKAEVALTNFNFTIAGMSREFGDSAGTLQTWTAVVDELAEKTLVTATDARKMAAEIMAVGHGLGMTRQQMEDLIKLIPNYLKAGDNAFDVTVSFLQALGGAPQGLLKYAVHLSDAGVEHSKFAKSANLVMSSLSEEQKVQARFNALMEQAAPIMGRANVQLQTVAGSQQYLGNTILAVQEKLGKQTFLISALNIAFAKLATQALKLPDEFYTIVGVLQDVGGVTLKVVGTFISLAFPIAAVASAFAILNAAVASNATVQLIATKAMTLTNVALGGQAIAVTSAATFWSGFATILKGVVVTSFSALISSLAATGSAIMSFTGALLTNPLFWKAAAIVAGIALVVAALKRIEEETQIFSQLLTAISTPFNNLIKYFTDGGKAASGFANIIGTVVSKAVDVAVIAVAAIINGVYTLIYAFNQLASGIAAPWNALADALKLPKIEIFDEAANQAYQTMEKLTGTMGKAASNLFDFGNSAQASTSGMDDLTKGAKQARDALAGLSKELITANEKTLILAQSQGNQAAVLLASKAVALDKMKLAKEYKDKQEIAKELFKLDAEIAQFPVDALKDAQKTYADLQISDLEQLNTVAAIRQAGALKAKQALDPLREKIKELQLLPATDKTKQAMEQLKAVVAKTQSSINTDTEKKVVDLNNARLQAEFSARESLAKLMGDTAALAQVTYEKEVQGYKKMLDEKLISAEQFQAAEKKLRQTRDEAPAKKAMSEDLKMAGDMLSAAQSGANALVSKVVPEVTKMAAVAAGLPPEVGEMIGQFVNFFRQGGDFLKNFGKELISIIVDLPVMLIEGVVGLIEGLIEGIFKLLTDPAKLGKIIAFIAQGLPLLISKVVTAVAKALPQFLKILLDPKFYIEVASQFVRTLWDAFIGMIYAIGDMLASIFTGDIFDGMESATNNLGKTVDAGIRYATNALTGVSEQMFGVMEDTAKQGEKAAAGKVGGGDAEGKKKKEANWFQKYIIQPIAKVVNFIWEGIKGVGDYLWGIIEPGIGFIMNAIAVPIKIAMELVSATFDIVGEGLKATWNAMVEYLKGGWEVIVATFKAVWNFGVAIFNGVINIFKTVFTEIANVFKGVWNFAKSIFDAIIKTFRALWDFVSGIFDDPIAAFEKLWDDLSNVVNDLWKSITELGTVIWDAIKNIGSAMWKAFSSVGEAVWEGLKSISGKIWDMFMNVGNAIWEGIKNIGSRIGESLSNVGTYLWDGIKGAFENVKSFFKNLFSFDGGGTGAVEDFLDFDFPWLAFAEGGKVPGTPKVFGDSLKNDTVAALLSPGEYVIPRSKMQDPMNLMMIDAIMSGGMMRDWIEQGLTGGVQKKGYGEWIEKAGSKGIEFHAWYDDVGDAIAGGAKAVVDTVVAAGDVIAEGFSKVGDFVMPDWLVGVWDSIKMFISNLDLGALISDPSGYLEKMIKNFSDFLVEPARKMMGFADGGLVPGFGTGDTVPAMLTPGEFVINRGAAKNLGAGLLNQLNGGMMPAMAGAGQSPVFNINLNIETSEAIDDNYIRTRLIPTIKQEIRSSSLRGEFLVSSKGVR